ncbi:hypothetical protein T484DRAFT_1943079 [Baffinella frigidus]|nr:hypothetical protein T484DRAFT_1943079 [Cryptophyta sp. CCMP2293]
MDLFACCRSRGFDKSQSRQQEAGAPVEKLCGLGIAFKPNKQGTLTVKRLVPGGPAALAGTVESGDALHAIDGVNVIGMEKPQVADLLVGPQGSTVRLRFLRPVGNSTKFVDLELQRQPFTE